MELDQILNRIYPLSQPAQLRLAAYARELSYPKGHILLRAGKVERSLFFIRKGMVRAYSTFSDAEVTFWFGKEGDTVISMKSYVAGQKGYEDIELLEDCELYALKIKDLQKLFAEDIQVANWGRKFAEQELIKTEERLISRLFLTATERYQELLLNSPGLLQRVPLGQIASYLGITQVSLSRIRAQLK